MNFKRIINKKILIFIFAIAISYITVHISESLIHIPQVYPDLAVSPVLGIMFGPYAALGTAIFNFYYDLVSGISFFMSLVDLITVFLISYIPYKLWNTSFINKKNNILRLNSVHNIVKLIFILFINVLVYYSIYSLLYKVLFGSELFSLHSLMLGLNFFNFSIVFTIIGILFFNFLNIPFYYPKDDSNNKFKFLKKLRINSKLATFFLIIGIATAFFHGFINYFFNYDINHIVMGVIIFSSFILYSFKKNPDNVKYNNYKNIIVEGVKIKKFNTSLIEKLIIMFIILDIIIIVLFILASYFNILTNVFDFGNGLSLLFYIDVAFLLFFIPSIIFLWYMEKKITKPLDYISNAVNHYITKDNLSKTNKDLINKKYLKQDTEIGNLSRSFVKMTKDLEDYIEEVKTLSSEKERFKTELAIAKKIQESFIPKNFDSIKDKGINIAGLMIPAKEVGGDFYDFFMVDDNHLAIVIGDVSDKGVPAALFMIVTKTLIQEYSYLIDDPNEIFNKVNNSLCKNNKENMFVTGWMGLLELDSGKFSFVNAGHEPPLVRLNQENKNYHWLKTKPGFVLGGFENIKYKINEIKLNYGDRIILYTDGVTEANNKYSGFFGEEGLLNAASEKENIPINEELEFIKNEIYKFTDGAEQFDDITLLIMEYNKGE